MKESTLREINAAFTKQDQEKLATLAQIAGHREQPEARFLVEMVRRMFTNVAMETERRRRAAWVNQSEVKVSGEAIPGTVETMEVIPGEGIQVDAGDPPAEPIRDGFGEPTLDLEVERLR